MTADLQTWLREAGRVTAHEEGEQMTLDGGSTRMVRLFNSAGESRLVTAETAESYGYRPKPKQQPLRAPQTNLFGESGYMFGGEQ